MSGGEQVIRGKYGCAWCGRTEPDTDPRRPWLCVRFDGLVGFVARFHSACAGILRDSMAHELEVSDVELDQRLRTFFADDNLEGRADANP